MGTVTKALSLLNYFAPDRPEIGLSDLTRLSNMNKATVYRLMGELQAAGFVEQGEGDRAYRLGPQVLHLAALREASTPILSVSRRILRELSDETGETTHVSLGHGSWVQTLSHAYSPRHATKVTMEDAQTVTYHATSSGLAILAYADPQFVDSILSQPLKSHTNLTLVDPDLIRSKLEQIRQTGLADTLGSFELEVHSHAVPIFGADHRAIGALAVAAPAARMTAAQQDTIRAALRRAGAALTHRIGGRAPADYPQSAAS
ncbi:IclR family transcriptional regulator [Pseudophaeobacter flagellatus]|uniref:IclR family transcriptional regulator n=1 Tax=Pseudophaeobacter flagellatus TaxID=2899119 RepID=UPI001E452447|nr:IclR family transcriptional regulator [Pseudophaeobacter flagellatus]MCD9148292.1 IclR family transcriptional regulator [Pseudophaeobacter flagellatus]